MLFKNIPTKTTVKRCGTLLPDFYWLDDRKPNITRYYLITLSENENLLHSYIKKFILFVDLVGNKIPRFLNARILSDKRINTSELCPVHGL